MMCRSEDALVVVAATADALNMDSLAIVRAAAIPRDLESLAALKEEWAALAAPATAAERGEFVSSLERWMAERGESVVCLVAELEGSLIGMAWLIIFERVPNVRDFRRRTGDIQSVFVRPHFRGAGVGGRLISGLVGVADEMGIPRVTVSANARSASLYQSQGFVATPTLLERPGR
jgi:GNAT superfamily N-acetyltransferase